MPGAPRSGLSFSRQRSCKMKDRAGFTTTPLDREMSFRDKIPLPAKLRIKSALLAPKRLLSKRRPGDEQRVEWANRTGPLIVVFDDRVPTPDRDAGSARMMNILLVLSRYGR